MSTLAEIETAFATYLHGVVPSRQLVHARAGEGPAPTSPACLWWVEEFVPDDFPYTREVGDDQVVHGVTPVTFRVACIGGPTTREDCWRISAGLRLTQRTGDLYRVCGLWGTTRVQDLTAVETGTMRQRAEFTVTLSVDLTFTAPRESIDEVAVLVTEPAKQFDKTLTIQGPT